MADPAFLICVSWPEGGWYDAGGSDRRSKWASLVGACLFWGESMGIGCKIRLKLMCEFWREVRLYIVGARGVEVSRDA